MSAQDSERLAEIRNQMAAADQDIANPFASIRKTLNPERVKLVCDAAHVYAEDLRAARDDQPRQRVAWEKFKKSLR